MGTTARAYLAYGYDLGGPEDFKAAERGEFGEPRLPWLGEDESDENERESFSEGVERLLLAATGFVEIPWEQRQHDDEDTRKAYYAAEREAKDRHGVELDHTGHYDYAGWVLIAKGSSRSVEWSEVMTLDLDELAGKPAGEGWDTKLGEALTVLGITPVQHSPKWLVYPTYG